MRSLFKFEPYELIAMAARAFIAIALAAVMGIIGSVIADPIVRVVSGLPLWAELMSYTVVCVALVAGVAPLVGRIMQFIEEFAVERAENRDCGCTLDDNCRFLEIDETPGYAILTFGPTVNEDDRESAWNCRTRPGYAGGLKSTQRLVN